MLLKDMLRHRNAWLGVAIIWIAFFHSNIDFGSSLLHRIFSFGYGGVDICLFASGVGCYYSLSANSDVGAFMKKRLRRLAPTYLCFIVFWLLYKQVTAPLPFQVVLGNVFGVQHLTGLGGEFNWYISAILLFYFLAPYLKIVTDKATPVGQTVFLAFLVLLTVPFWFSVTYIIIVTRLPVFCLGMFFAKAAQKEKRATGKFHALIAAAFLIGLAMLVIFYKYHGIMLWAKGLSWYPFILMTPGICVLISYVAAAFEKVKLLSRLTGFLELAGKYSFEIYLIHIPLIEIIILCINRFGLHRYRDLIWGAGVILLAAGCVILKRLAELTVKCTEHFASAQSRKERAC